MKSLITGAAGQVGQDLASVLLQHGDVVVATDLHGKPSGISEAAGLSWSELDVCDSEATKRKIAEVSPDRVFHLAAILSARGEAEPKLTYEVNQSGLYHTLEACRVAKVGQLFLASTIAVYGPNLKTPVPENVELCPTTMYGVTKASGEMLGQYYRLRYGLDFRSIRLPGLISPVVPGGGSSDYALYMYLDSIKHGHYCCYCRPETRIPFMYMPDAVRAIVEFASAKSSLLSRSVYNIAAFSPTAREIAESVKTEIPGASITFDVDEQRQSILDSWPRELDDSAARADWGWKPEFDLDTMSSDLVAMLRTRVATSK